MLLLRFKSVVTRTPLYPFLHCCALLVLAETDVRGQRSVHSLLGLTRRQWVQSAGSIPLDPSVCSCLRPAPLGGGRAGQQSLQPGPGEGGAPHQSRDGPDTPWPGQGTLHIPRPTPEHTPCPLPRIQAFTKSPSTGCRNIPR